MDLSHLTPEQLTLATKTAADLLAQVADYIAIAQPTLDKRASADATYSKQAHVLAGQLAAQGIIAHAEVNKTAEYLVANPANALTLASHVADRSKLASAEISGQSVLDAGSPTPHTDLNPFQKLALYGDHRADVSHVSSTAATLDS